MRASVQAADSLGEDYLDAYFRMFPTRATEAGRHDLDKTLEDFSAERRARWIAFNERQR